MAATIGGAGLGLFNSSLLLGRLGATDDPATGRRSEQIYVNSATGNLVVQQSDDQLASLGIRPDLLRTYNSQGSLDGDNNDGWRIGVYRSVALSGTRNATGSTVTKTFGDGSRVVYAWNGSAYLSTAGDGAHDTLVYDTASANWIWTDGSSRTTEAYSGANGRLVSSRDTDGNATTYTYNTSGRLTSVADASGQTTYLDYAGANLTQVRVVSQGQTQTRTRYDYDGYGRLWHVTVDLTPGDNSVADGRTYVTTYTYSGTTTRVASITQSDGSSVAFAYVTLNGQARVQTVTVTAATGVTRVTRYAYSGYSSANGGYYTQTDITDALNLVTTYRHDAGGRLSSVLSPTVGGARLRVDYGYDTSGNLTTVTSDPGGLNRVTTYGYDANGNLTSSRDALGNSMARTYSAANQLLSETRYVVPDPDGAGTGQPAAPLTTRYAYDAEQHLRFVVTAAGRVTEYRYNTAGLRTTVLSYVGNAYTATAFDEASLATWAGTQDRTRLLRTDHVYDFRGQVSSSSAWSTTDATGAGTGSPSVTLYTYDQRGLLLNTTEARGAATTGDATDYVTSFTYDGLYRVLTTTQWLAAGQTRNTSFTYDDAGRRVISNHANGLVSTETYDQAGGLLSVVNTGPAAQNLGTTTYRYDARGQLRITTDATGQRQFFLYDTAGRKVADVDADGSLTEFVYDAASNVVKTIRYAVLVPAATVNTLADASGNPSTTSQTTLLNTLRTAAGGNAAADQVSRSVYDSAGRQVYAIDPAGSVTEMRYDGAGRLTDTIEYAAPVSIARSVNQLLPSQVVVTPDAVADRRVRFFYDDDGLSAGKLDAEGYLTENVYNAAGQLIQTIAYANPTSATLRATGTLAQLRPAADTVTTDDAEQDAHTHYFYDGQARLVGQLDAEGYLTETVYDAGGRAAQTIRYGNVLAYTAGATLASLRPATGARQTTSHVYDGIGQRIQETNFEGTVTTYAYDGAGRLVSATAAAGTTEARTTQTRYDALGRIVAELSGEGSRQITAGMTQAQIDAVWNQWSVRFAYDLAGRVISRTDPMGNKAVFYHDADGRPRFVVNAAGEVAETRYNALGQIVESIGYTNRVATTGLNGGLLTAALATQLTPVPDAARDSRTSFTYTLTGKVATTTTAIGSVVTHHYNAFGEEDYRLDRIDATRTRRTEYGYDRRGLLTGTRNDVTGLNAVTSARYDAFGRMWSSTDAIGNTRQTVYDRLDRTVAAIDANGARSATAYDAFGRTIAVTDARGNVNRYAYDDATRTATLTTAENNVISTVHNRYGQTLTVTAAGSTTTYGYDSNGQLVSTSDGLGTLESRAYDRGGRLDTSTDARGVVTKFAYDAANRVFTQTLDFGAGRLQLATVYAYDGQGRITQVTEPNGRITRTDYDAGSRTTLVTVDPTGLNERTSYTYDLEGRALTVTAGVGSANPVTTQYTYDTLGRRITQTEDFGTGRLNLQTQFRYDLAGNLRRSIDAGGASLWYFYDANNRPVAVINAQGEVSRTAYDADGRITTVRLYANRADVSAFGDAPLLPALATSAQDSVSHTAYDRDGRAVYSVSGIGGVTELTLDALGRVTRSRTYAIRIAAGSYATSAQVQAALTAAGNSLTALGAQDLVSWSVYDPRGQLAYRIDGTGGVTQMQYDGSGNLVQTTAFAVRRDVSLATDHASLQAFATANAANAGNVVVRQAYDRAGRQVMTSDGTGVRSHALYDALGRRIAIVDGNGSLTEYVYDAVNRLVATVSYAPAVPAATLATLVDGSGNPVAVSLATLKTAISRSSGPTAADQVSRSVYDSAGRLIYSIDTAGAVMRTSYDTAGRVTEITRFANTVTIAPATTMLTPSAVTVTANAARDRTSRNFYDGMGRLLGVLDAEGFLVEHKYDSLGHLVQTVGYANATSASLRATGTLAQLRPVADTGATDGDTERDINAYFYFDAMGRVAGALDGEGYFEERVYDNAGNVSQRVRYDRVLTWSATATLQSLKTAAAGAATQVTSYVYDGAGRAVQQVDHQGTISTTAFDRAGRTASATVAAGTAEARTRQTRYDAQGRVAQELSGEGSRALASASGQAAIDQVWDRYGVRYTYDAAGRLATKSSQAWDPVRNTTQTLTTAYYYDADGRTRFTLNGLGEVSEQRYNNFGQLTESLTYFNRLASGAGSGGLLNESQAAGFVPALNAQADARMSYTYSLAGQVLTETSAMGASTTHHYDTFGQEDYRIVQVDATRTRRTDYVYDRRGLMTDTWTDTAGFNLHEIRGYDAFGRVRVTTDARGLVSRSDYDTLNRVVGLTDTAGGTRAMTYDGFGRVLTLRDETGATTRYAYSDASRSVTVTTPEGISAQTVSTRHGETLSITGAGNTTTYTYNADGSLVATSDALGTLESRAYDSAGRLVTTADGKGSVTRLGYDAASRVLTRTVDDGGPSPLVTAYQFDGQGRTTQVTEPGGRVTRTDYDRDGRISLVTVDPTGANLRTFYTYDLEARVVNVTDNYGTSAARITRHTYDTLGRRTEQAVDPLGLNLRTQYKYDADGNVTRVIDAAGASTWYVYDNKNRRVFSINTLGIATRTAYDAMDRALVVRRYYTPANTSGFGDQVSLAAASAAVAAHAKDEVDQTIYDQDGRALFHVDAAGAVTERRFDDAGRVVRSRTYGRAVPVSTSAYASAAALRTALGAAGNLGPDTFGGEDKVSWIAYDQRGRASFMQSGTGGVIGYAYDGAGNVTTETRYAALRSTTAGTTHAAFVASVNPADANNVVTRFWYDGANRSRFVLDGEGFLTETRYGDSAREVRQITYASARSIAANASLATVVASATIGATDQVVITRTDTAGRLASVTDGEGNVTAYAYELGITDANDARVRSRTRITDANNGVRIDSFDLLGRMVSTRSALGNLVRHTYDSMGNVLSSTQSRVNTSTGAAVTGTGNEPRTTAYVYDVLNRMTRLTDAEGFVTTFEYDVFGNQTRIHTGQYLLTSGEPGFDINKAARAANLVTQYAYDTLNRVVDATDGLSNVTHYTYDTAGNRKTETEGYTGSTGAGTRTTTFTYDAANQRVRVTSPLNGITETTYWGTGAVRTERVLQSARIDTAATGESTGRILLDAAGNPLGDATNPVVWTTKTREYFRNGRLRAETDDYGTRNETYYDAAGNVTELRWAAGSTDQRSLVKRYDRANREVASLDGNGAVTSFAYDRVGNRIKITTPPNAQGRAAVAHYYYDADNQLAEVVDPEGVVTTFAYDLMGRQRSSVVHRTVLTPAQLAAVSDTVAPTPTTAAGDRTVTQVFDLTGHLVSLTAPDGTRTDYINDATGKKLSERQFANTAASRQMLYFYDRAGRLVTFVDVDGTSTAFTYDAAGNRKSEAITRSVSSTDPHQVRLTEYDYDLNNRRITETFDRTGLNIVRSLRYDAAGNLVSRGVNALTETGLATESYTYDLNNRVKSHTQGVTVANLTSFGGPATTESYGYDRAGNRTSVTDGRNNTTTYVYDRNNRVTEELLPAVTVYTIAGGQQSGVRPRVQHVYDAAGNEVQTIDANGNRTTSWYDRDNRLVGRLSGVNGLARYTYTAFGQVETQTEYETPLPASAHNPAALPAAPAGRQRLSSFTYDAAGRLTVATLPSIDVTTLAGTSGSNPTSSRATPTLTERHVYNAYGDEVETYDRAGNRTLHYYDVKHREVATVDAMGYLVQQDYDTMGNVREKRVYRTPLASPGALTPATPPTASINDADITTWLYDAASRVTAQLDPLVDIDVANVEIAGSYSATNFRRLTTYTYDQAGNLKSTTIGANLNDSTAVPLTERYYYDAGGRRVGMIDKNRVTTRYFYDAAGHLTREWRTYKKLADTANLDFLTATFALPSEQVDATQDQVTDYVYDAAGRQVDEIDRMRFDASLVNGAITDARPGDDLHTTSTYDAAGNRTKLSVYEAPGSMSTLANVTHYDTLASYDAMGHVVQSISGGGVIHGATGSVVRRDMGVGSVLAYDVWGNLLSTYTGAGGVLEYDAAGRPVYVSAAPATGVTATLADGVVGIDYTIAAGPHVSSYVVWDTVSHDDVGDYAQRASGSTAANGASHAEIAGAGGTIYFRVVTLDGVGNIAWTAERTLNVPSQMVRMFLTDTNTYWANNINAEFSGPVSNVQLLYGLGPELANVQTVAMTQLTDGTGVYRGQMVINNTSHYAVRWTDSAGVVRTSQVNSIYGGSEQVDLTTTTTQARYQEGSLDGYRLQAEVKIAASAYNNATDIKNYTQMQASWKLAGSTGPASTTGFVGIAEDNSAVYDATRRSGTYTFRMVMGSTQLLAAGTYRVEITGRTSDGRTMVLDSYDVVVGPSEPASRTQQTSSWVALPDTPMTGYGELVYWQYGEGASTPYRDVQGRFPIEVASDGRRVMHVPVMAQERDNYKVLLHYGDQAPYPPATVNVTSSNPAGPTTTLTFTITLSPQEAATVDETPFRTGGNAAFFVQVQPVEADGYIDPTDGWWGGQVNQVSPGVYSVTLANVAVRELEYHIQYNVDPSNSTERGVYSAVGHIFVDSYNAAVASTTGQHRTYIETQQVSWGTIWYTPYLDALTEGYQGRLYFDASVADLPPVAGSGSLALGNGPSGVGTGARSTDGRQLGYLIEMLYDAHDNKVASNEQGGLYTEYGVDRSGNVVETRLYGEKNGAFQAQAGRAIVSHATYDARNRQTAQFDAAVPLPDGTLARPVRRVEAYDAYDHATRMRDANGNLTELRYNALGWLTLEIDHPNDAVLPAGVVTQRRYNIRGQETQLIQPRGGRSFKYYDTLGRLQRERNEIGQDSAGYQSDLFDRVIAKTDGRGMATARPGDYTETLLYDQRDRLVARVSADAWHMLNDTSTLYSAARSALGYTFTPSGADEAVNASTLPTDTLARLFTTTFTYNARDQQTMASTGQGLGGSWAANINGGVYGHGINTTYDSAGRVIAVDETGRSLAAGQTPVIVKHTESRYDVYGNVVSQTEGMPGTATAHTRTSVYGAFGRLEQMTDENGVTFTYRYDDFGRQTEEEGSIPSNDPRQADLQRYILRSYDDGGRLTQVIDAGTGVFTDYKYDLNGNRKRETVTQNALWFDGTFQRLATLRDMTYSYDGLNRVTRWVDATDNRSDVQAVADVTSNMNENYEYDADGNRRRIYTDAATRNAFDNVYTFNLAGQVTGLSSTQGGATRTSSWTYDAAGYRSTYSEPFGITTRYTFANGSTAVSAEGRLWNMERAVGSNNGVTHQAWAYDPSGRIIRSETTTQSVAFDGTRTLTTDSTSTVYNTTDPLGPGQPGVYATLVDVAAVSQSVNGGASNLVRTSVTAHDQAGRVIGRRDSQAGGGQLTSTYTYYGDGREATVTTEGTGLARPGVSRSTYDSNYRLQRLDRDQGGMQDHPEVITFVYDNEGNIHHKTRDIGFNSGTQQPLVEHSKYFYENGRPVGELNGAFGSFDSGHYASVPATSADYPAGTSTYSVTAGETLQSIASKVYGNASLWFVIADANGLSGAEALETGRQLVIPSTVQAGELTAETHAIYNEDRIIGSTLPNLLAAPPKKPSAWAVVLAAVISAIVVVLAAVVSIVSYGTLTAGAAAAGGGIIGAVYAGLAGATIGATLAGFTLASQALRQQILTGGYDLKPGEVFRSFAGGAASGLFAGLASGVTAGAQLADQASGIVGSLSSASSTWAPVASNALAAVGAATGQLVSSGRVNNVLGLAASFVAGSSGNNAAIIATGAASPWIDAAITDATRTMSTADRVLNWAGAAASTLSIGVTQLTRDSLLGAVRQANDTRLSWGPKPVTSAPNSIDFEAKFQALRFQQRYGGRIDTRSEAERAGMSDGGLPMRDTEGWGNTGNVLIDAPPGTPYVDFWDVDGDVVTASPSGRHNSSTQQSAPKAEQAPATVHRTSSDRNAPVMSDAPSREPLPVANAGPRSTSAVPDTAAAARSAAGQGPAPEQPLKIVDLMGPDVLYLSQTKFAGNGLGGFADPKTGMPINLGASLQGTAAANNSRRVNIGQFRRPLNDDARGPSQRSGEIEPPTDWIRPHEEWGGKNWAARVGVSTQSRSPANAYAWQFQQPAIGAWLGFDYRPKGVINYGALKSEGVLGSSNASVSSSLQAGAAVFGHVGGGAFDLFAFAQAEATALKVHADYMSPAIPVLPNGLASVKLGFTKDYNFGSVGGALGAGVTARPGYVKSYAQMGYSLGTGQRMIGLVDVQYDKDKWARADARASDSLLYRAAKAFVTTPIKAAWEISMIVHDVADAAMGAAYRSGGAGYAYQNNFQSDLFNAYKNSDDPAQLTGDLLFGAATFGLGNMLLPDLHGQRRDVIPLEELADTIGSFGANVAMSFIGSGSRPPPVDGVLPGSRPGGLSGLVYDVKSDLVRAMDRYAQRTAPTPAAAVDGEAAAAASGVSAAREFGVPVPIRTSQRLARQLADYIREGYSDSHVHGVTDTVSGPRGGQNGYADQGKGTGGRGNVYEFADSMGPRYRRGDSPIPQSTTGGCCPASSYYMALRSDSRLVMHPAPYNAPEVMLTGPNSVRVKHNLYFRGANDELLVWPKGNYILEGLDTNVSRGFVDLRTLTTRGKEVGINIIPDMDMTLGGVARTRDMIDFYAQIARERPDLAERMYVGLTNVSPRLPNGAAEIDNALAYAMQRHPDAAGKLQYMGFGETNTFYKEIVESQVSLAGYGPHTLENIHSYMNKLDTELPGSMIVIHSDAGPPMEALIRNAKGEPMNMRALISAQIKYPALNPIVELAQRYPNVNVVWAHGGGISRSGFPGAMHADMLDAALQAAPNLYIDLSWGTVAQKIIRNNHETGAWAAPGGRGVVNKYPDRFLYGSDEIGQKIETYHGPLRTYVESGFLGDMTHPDLFVRDNAARLMDSGNSAFQRYIRANAEELRRRELTGDWSLAKEPGWSTRGTGPGR